MREVDFPCVARTRLGWNGDQLPGEHEAAHKHGKLETSLPSPSGFECGTQSRKAKEEGNRESSASCNLLSGEAARERSAKDMNTAAWDVTLSGVASRFEMRRG